MKTLDLVRAIASGDTQAAQQTFDTLAQERVDSQLSERHEEVTASMFETNEAYRGKHPEKIREVIGHKETKGMVTVKLNNGTKHQIHAKDTMGKMPKTGEHISKYMKEGYEIEEILEEITEEEFKALDEASQELYELSKTTLGSYVKRAGQSRVNLSVRKNELDTDEHNIRRADHNSSPAARTALRAAGDAIHKDARKIDDKSHARAFGIHRAVARLTKEDLDEMSQEDFDALVEDFEQLDELSKATLGSYVKKAADDARISTGMAVHKANKREIDSSNKFFLKSDKRSKGIDKAVNKMTK